MNLKRIFQKFKNVYHLSKSIVANLRFAFPARKIIVVGVTGTNGKTTTVQMIGKILEATGEKVAIYSTINFQIGEKKWTNKTKFTTQSSWHLQKFIKQSNEEGCKYLVLETSSHALDQFRTWGIDYNIAVVTNITREHLDYHHTMEDYRKAKLKLFRRTAGAWGRISQKIGVVNRDMEKFREFVLPGMDKCYLYGIDFKKAGVKNCPTWKAENIVLNNFKSEFEIDGAKFKLNLPGKFNIENALAAICVGVSQGVSINKIRKQLAEIKEIPGRMEFVKNRKGIYAIVDYALTPDSMEKLGEMMKDFKKKNKSKLIWVFGSCGDRDRGKRPIMGEIVSRYADLIITTNEDPYTEDPVQIVEEIEAGINPPAGGKKKLIREMDRKKALKKALEEANRGDIVLVTGKGAEENMMIGKKKIPWNDKKIIHNILNN